AGNGIALRLVLFRGETVLPGSAARGVRPAAAIRLVAVDARRHRSGRAKGQLRERSGSTDWPCRCRTGRGAIGRLDGALYRCPVSLARRHADGLQPAGTARNGAQTRAVLVAVD